LSKRYPAKVTTGGNTGNGKTNRDGEIEREGIEGSQKSITGSHR